MTSTASKQGFGIVGVCTLAARSAHWTGNAVEEGWSVGGQVMD